MNDSSWIFLLVIVSFFSFMWGYANCLSTYYKRAETGKPFAAKGKVYVMREVAIKEYDYDSKN